MARHNTIWPVQITKRLVMDYPNIPLPPAYVNAFLKCMFPFKQMRLHTQRHYQEAVQILYYSRELQKIQRNLLVIGVAAPELKRLVAGFPPRRPGFEPGSGHLGFVVDKVALGQVFSEYFGFPCQSSFHQLLHSHPHLSSGVCTIGQKWPQYLLDLVPPH
jgi:hypothetical protein